MDLDALRFANLKLLDDAVSDWSRMVRKLADLQKSADKGLRRSANKASWAGVNATVSREFIGKTAAEFDDAHAQAETIFNILKDTRDELRDYKKQLQETIERGSEKHLKVISNGDGGFTVKATEGGKEQDHSEADLVGLRDDIQKILDKATKSDDSSAKVLMAIVDQSPLGFTDANYKDRNSAVKAVVAANDMSKILKKDPHDVTATELNRLNDTLARYKNDPLFTEQFATEVGPKRALEFYAGIADPYQGYGRDPKRDAQAKKLQKNLGITLGSATLSDSDRMRSWERQMVQMGPERLGIDDADNPTGFGVMSNLMRFGDYDDEFMNEYGKKLYEFDKEHNVEDVSPWINNSNQADLNLWGKNDRGRDPMTGFLEALGHNPDASTQFFGQPDATKGPIKDDSEINEHLKYLTKDRIWLSDSPILNGDNDFVAGRDALGHALEAATTGFAYDAKPVTEKDAMIPGSGDRRTGATADVMEQIVHLYGSESGPNMLHDQPEMHDSLGKMGAAYIDDINYHLSGVGDSSKDDGDFTSRYADRANFGNQGAINFLSVLGQNETSHSIVTVAQHMYTLSELDAHPPASEAAMDHGRDVMTTGAEARGILDNSRVQQAEATYGKEAEDAEKSLARSADWGKLAAGAVVAGGIAAIPLPGSTAAAIVVAPVAADTAGEVLKTFIGQEIDKSVDAAADSPKEKAQLTSQQFYNKGITDLGDSYDSYFKDHPKAAEKGDQQQWKEEIKASYLGTGSHQNDYRGRPPRED